MVWILEDISIIKDSFNFFFLLFPYDVIVLH